MFIEAYRPRLMQTLTAKTPLGGLFATYPRIFLADAVIRPAVNEAFGPNSKPSDELWRQFSEIMDYNDGRRVAHKVGRFILDRYHHRNRWVRAMRETSVPMRFIDGPYDPNSGRHMAARYAELIPEPDVVLLDDKMGIGRRSKIPRASSPTFSSSSSRWRSAPSARPQSADGS